jgi:mannose-6-phosphate isomerase-like protein (cupin superfamily)
LPAGEHGRNPARPGNKNETIRPPFFFYAVFLLAQSAAADNVPEEMTEDSRRRFTVAEALARLPDPEGKRFATVFEHGSLVVEIYAPRGTDPQQPHTRDEAYVVIQGNGEFLCGERRQPFGPGDFLFAPATMKHRFENFSEDFAVWVMFYGPEGGES